MIDGAVALDEAYDRMAGLDFELPNGFVNHGPMACEALAALGLDDHIDAFSRWFVQHVGTGPRAARPLSFTGTGWQEALGDYRRLPEWIGYFDAQVAAVGWAPVVGQWVPRLMPALATALFHGAIRSAQAVRAVAAADTAPRQAELARSLGYWAARYRPGAPLDRSHTERHRTDGGQDSTLEDALLAAAARGSRHYVAAPTIYNLHGVTGAMAVDLLLGHLATDDAAAALAHVRAEHAAMYGPADPDAPVDPGQRWDEQVAGAAAESHDAHQVKLVEACHRGFVSTADPAFAAAARRVTRRR